MGRKPKFTALEMAAAITKNRGMDYLTAESLKCSHTTVGNYIKRFACCRDAKEQARGKFKDIAEVKLMDAVIAGEGWAIKFALQMLGNDRGYVPSIKHEGTGKDGAILVEERYTDDQRNRGLAAFAGCLADALRARESASDSGQGVAVDAPESPAVVGVSESGG